MISQRMEEALNKQINEELFSSYLYLSMSAHFENMSLSGFANWMRIQSQEESFHGMKLFDYVNERGGVVKLKAIEAPKLEWNSIIDIFEETLAHEQHITSKINELMKIAQEENDFATSSFLQWYVSEQVEEEATAGEILDQLKFIEDDKRALLMIEREMRGRVFTPPVTK